MDLQILQAATQLPSPPWSKRSKKICRCGRPLAVKHSTPWLCPWASMTSLQDKQLNSNVSWSLGKHFVCFNSYLEEEHFSRNEFSAKINFGRAFIYPYMGWSNLCQIWENVYPILSDWHISLQAPIPDGSSVQQVIQPACGQDKL